ncbi:hypothetical protein QYE76_060187 [Lolium multiflorum]|uniref:VPS9 domain-containing protein n=1 Tax=Lolium multiflorum TaxID=4521 RepID=A0AAD8RYM0_LOLMU|nr:hypothetical protein QYE76_060187 [Lolium multiflorum]
MSNLSLPSDTDSERKSPGWRHWILQTADCTVIGKRLRLALFSSLVALPSPTEFQISLFLSARAGRRPWRARPRMRRGWTSTASSTACAAPPPPASSAPLHQELPRLPLARRRGGRRQGPGLLRGDGGDLQGAPPLGQRHPPGDRPRARGPREVRHDQALRPHLRGVGGGRGRRRGGLGEDRPPAAVRQASALGHTKVLHSEASWLLAVKELQKINSFKSPRDKLLCVMSCCQVINNLLLNVSMSNDRTPSGADEFLPILIYITIKANPPHLHSNLKFVQIFRRETKLVSEVEYYLTNLISAKMFIVNVDGRSLSMEENEFQMHMETAKLGTEICVASLNSPQGLATSTRGLRKQTDTEGSRFPFMDSETESLTAAELKQLHELYRQVVTRYTSLSKALRKLSIDEDQLLASVDDDS